MIGNNEELVCPTPIKWRAEVKGVRMHYLESAGDRADVD